MPQSFSSIKVVVAEPLLPVPQSHNDPFTSSSVLNRVRRGSCLRQSLSKGLFLQNDYYYLFFFFAIKCNMVCSLTPSAKTMSAICLGSLLFQAIILVAYEIKMPMLQRKNKPIARYTRCCRLYLLPFQHLNIVFFRCLLFQDRHQINQMLLARHVLQMPVTS